MLFRDSHHRHTNVAIPWYRKLANWVVIQAVAAATAACSAATPTPGATPVPGAAPTEQPAAQVEVYPAATQQPPVAEVTPTSDPNTWVRFYPPGGNPLPTVPCSNHRDNFASPQEVTVKAGAEVPFNALRAIAHKCQDDLSLLKILYFAGGGLVRTMVGDDGNTYYLAQPPGCTLSECTPALDIPLADITFLLYVNSKEVTDEVSAVQRGDLIIEYLSPTPIPFNTPISGSTMGEWGDPNYDITVWGSNHELLRCNGVDPADFICARNDPPISMHYWDVNNPWIRAECNPGTNPGTIVCQFSEPVINLVINTSYRILGIDHITFRTVDGIELPYGFAADPNGKYSCGGVSCSIVPSFMDTGSVDVDGLLEALEHSFDAANLDADMLCGMAGLSLDHKITGWGDPLYGIGGVAMMRMLNEPTSRSDTYRWGTRGQRAYQISRMTFYPVYRDLEHPTIPPDGIVICK